VTNILKSFTYKMATKSYPFLLFSFSGKKTKKKKQVSDGAAANSLDNCEQTACLLSIEYLLNNM